MDGNVKLDLSIKPLTLVDLRHSLDDVTGTEEVENVVLGTQVNTNVLH